MPLFGSPNIKKMKAKRDVKELIKVLRCQKGDDVRRHAAEALLAVIQDSSGDMIETVAEALMKLDHVLSRTKLTPNPNLEEFAAAVRQIIGEPFEWCQVPEGPFLLGYFDYKNIQGASEPQVISLHGFYIAKYLITYDQFQVFIDAEDGIGDDRWWTGLAEEFCNLEPDTKIGNHPRNKVNWYQAIAFCRWLSWRLTSSQSPSFAIKNRVAFDLMNPATWLFRLPIEAEWEKAARGIDGRLYPWGNEFDKHKCTTIDSQPYSSTTPVDKYPEGASPYGVFDMSGNLWEWCLSESTMPYEHRLIDQIPIITISSRVVRGGGYFSSRGNARTPTRGWGNPYRNDDQYGIRGCGSIPF